MRKKKNVDSKSLEIGYQNHFQKDRLAVSASQLILISAHLLANFATWLQFMANCSNGSVSDWQSFPVDFMALWFDTGINWLIEKLKTVFSVILVPTHPCRPIHKFGYWIEAFSKGVGAHFAHVTPFAPAFQYGMRGRFMRRRGNRLLQRWMWATDNRRFWNHPF